MERIEGRALWFMADVSSTRVEVDREKLYRIYRKLTQIGMVIDKVKLVYKMSPTLMSL